MSTDNNDRLSIVGIGGTTKPGSSTEKALANALAECARLGARTTLIGGAALATLPLYSPEDQTRSQAQLDFIQAVRQADGVILATPAYHAGMSGLMKNAVDLLEDLRGDQRPYLHDRAVGCIVTAFGWQGAGTTLTSVRTIVHALRGWPTPLGITINTADRVFTDSGACVDERLQTQMTMLAAQIVGFANKFTRAAARI
jgi:FMN reductase